MTSTERPTSIRHRGASVAVAMAVMNLATYVFTALAARLLGPQDYGALASLMAVLLVVSVVQLGIQTTAARRISADPGHVGPDRARDPVPDLPGGRPRRRRACCC